MKNKLKLLHFIIVYPSLWLIYYVFEIVSKNISDTYSMVMNLLPALLLLIISYLFYKYCKKSIILKDSQLSIVILILFAIDQLSKITISTIFSKNNIYSFNIIPNYLSITPDLNDKGSFIASRFNINAPFVIFITLNFLILLFIFFTYRYILYKNKIDSINQLTFIFLFSGGLCSLIDKLFWGGSLDFLHIHNLFIADIKDIFITLGLCNFIIYNINSDYQIKIKDLMKFIINFLKFKGDKHES